MKLGIRGVLRSSVAVAALVTGSASFGQAAPSEGNPDPNRQIDTSLTSAEAGEEIVVTGYRASVQRAQDIKRRADTVVEVITAEDLGEFSDPSIADALQRVPGVSITRNYRGGDFGDTLNLRGLGSTYVKATVNGRELLGEPAFFGANGRDVDLGAIPPDVLGGIVVYKQPMASIVEPGLAGSLDLQTLRPLNSARGRRPGIWGSVSALGFYHEDRGEVSPHLSGIVGYTNPSSTMSVYVAAVHEEERFATRQFFTQPDTTLYTIRQRDAAGNVTVIPNVSGPAFVAPVDQERDSKRRSLASGLQWHVTDRLEVNLDFLYNRYKQNVRNDNPTNLSPFFELGIFPGEVLPGGVVIENGNIVAYDTSLFTDARPFSFFNGYQAALQIDQNTDNELINYGANVAWEPAEGTRVVVDGSYSTGNYFQDYLLLAVGNESGATFVRYDARNRVIPKVEVFGPGAAGRSNPASYTAFPGSNLLQSEGHSDRHSLRLDLEQELSQALTVSVGTRYMATEFDYRAVFATSLTFTPQASYFQAPRAFLGSPTDLVVLDRGGFCADPANNLYCTGSNRGVGSFAGDFPTDVAGKSGDLFPFSSGASYRVKEETLAFYAQASLKSRLFNMPFNANAGIRALKVDVDASAFQGVEARILNEVGVPDPTFEAKSTLVTNSNSYWEYLPSINLTLKPADNINLRLGAGKSLSLPQYSALAPKGSVTLVRGVAGGPNQGGRFVGGNTFLTPTRAWNYDVTGEYYTSYGGAFIGSVFYKDVSSVVSDSQQFGTLPQYGDLIFNIVSSFNATKGKVYGFELGTNQPFTFLPAPWSGFGVQANYTYSGGDNLVRVLGTDKRVPFLNNSRHSFNGTAYFESPSFDARLAFNYRSDQFQGARTLTNDAYIEPQYSLDASATLKIFEPVHIIFNATNLTKRNVREYWSGSGATRNFYEVPRTFQLGARFSF